MSNGTYAKLVLNQESQNKITAIATLINLENYARPNDLHATVIYSRYECSDVENIPVALPIKANGVSFEIFTNADKTNCLVLLLDSLEMQDLHEKCKIEYGATHDYPSYKPHLTLSYDYPNGNRPSEEWIGYFNCLTFDQYVVVPLDIDQSAHEHEQEN